MSLPILRSIHAWRPALSRFLQGFAPPETEPAPYPYTPDELARLHHLTASGAGALDEQTWRDLLLEGYADSLSGGVGIFGRQVLQRRLRAGVQEQEAAARRARIEQLLQEPPARLDGLQRDLRALRRAEVEVTHVLFDPA